MNKIDQSDLRLQAKLFHQACYNSYQKKRSVEDDNSAYDYLKQAILEKISYDYNNGFTREYQCREFISQLSPNQVIDALLLNCIYLEDRKQNGVNLGMATELVEMVRNFLDTPRGTDRLHAYFKKGAYDYKSGKKSLEESSLEMLTNSYITFQHYTPLVSFDQSYYFQFSTKREEHLCLQTLDQSYQDLPKKQY